MSLTKIEAGAIQPGAIAKSDLAIDVYTKAESDTALGLKANQSTTYTKTETDTALGLKANASDMTAALAGKQASLGYTPVDVSAPILGSQTNAWHYISNVRVDGSAGFVRKSKLFSGNTAQTVFKWRTNYGWFSGQIRIRLHEAGYIGGTYREFFLTGASGPNGYLVGQSYSPGVTNVTTQGYFGGYSISGTTGGGGVDIGYVDVTFTVTPSPYADCVVDVEFWGLSETASTPTSKGYIQFL